MFSQFIVEVTFTIRLVPLRWVPTAYCAGKRGLNLLTAVRPVKLVQYQGISSGVCQFQVCPQVNSYMYLPHKINNHTNHFSLHCRIELPGHPRWNPSNNGCARSTTPPKTNRANLLTNNLLTNLFFSSYSFFRRFLSSCSCFTNKLTNITNHRSAPGHNGQRLDRAPVSIDR